MRLFFAATIGFEIPIEHMNTQSLTKACILCTVIHSKISYGAFSQPLDSDHFWILAWAWGEWGRDVLFYRRRGCY